MGDKLSIDRTCLARELGISYSKMRFPYIRDCIRVGVDTYLADIFLDDANESYTIADISRKLFDNRAQISATTFVKEKLYVDTDRTKYYYFEQIGSNGSSRYSIRYFDGKESKSI